MKLLAVSPYIPWPLHGGPQLRIFNLMSQLTQRGHDVVLLAGQNRDAPGDKHPLRTVFSRIELFPVDMRSRGVVASRSLVSRSSYPFTRYVTRVFRNCLDGIIQDTSPDVVFVNFVALARPIAVPDRPVPVVVDEHESQALVWKDVIRSRSVAERAFGALNLAKVVTNEQRILRNVDALVCVSDNEAERARARTAPPAGVWTIPNGVSVGGDPSSAADPPGELRIMLCANYNVERNVDAAVWFATEVFPLVRKIVPAARFVAVGASPPPAVRELCSRENVEVTGTVPEVGPYYEAASVVVAPFRFGAGTKLKVLEALASGRPLVTTTNGAQGIGIERGIHAEIADQPQAIADAIVNLISDPRRGRRLASEALDLVRSRYAWQSIAQDLEGKLSELVTSSR